MPHVTRPLNVEEEIVNMLAMAEEYTDNFTVCKQMDLGGKKVFESQVRTDVIGFLHSVESKGLSNYFVTEWERSNCDECGSVVGESIISQTTADEWLADELAGLG